MVLHAGIHIHAGKKHKTDSVHYRDKHSNDLLNSYPVANYDMALMIVTTYLISQQIMGN